MGCVLFFVQGEIGLMCRVIGRLNLDFFDGLVLLIAGVLGGAVNAIAGGGTFFTFPAMLATGLDPLVANASSAVALYPAYASAITAYRDEIRKSGRQLWLRCAFDLLGGIVGY